MPLSGIAQEDRRLRPAHATALSRGEYAGLGAALLVLPAAAARTGIVAADLRAALPRRRVKQRPVAYAQLGMQLVVQLCKVLGEPLQRQLGGPEEAPAALPVQQAAELVESRALLAGVGRDLCQAERGLHRVGLDQQRLGVALAGAPAPAADVLEARQPQVVHDIPGIARDRFLDLRHHLEIGRASCRRTV